MAKPEFNNKEFDINAFDFEPDKLDRRKEDTIIVTVSMTTEEAEIRKQAATGTEGAKFDSYTSNEYTKKFGRRTFLEDGRVIGRSEAQDWEVMGEYNKIVKKLLGSSY